MKVLIINGSPKGNKSNTIKLTKAFVSGIQKKIPVEVSEVTLKNMNIKYCLGCFSCWGATPGECIIKDDMEDIREEILKADVIIESFPLYFFGMPGMMKNFTDRMLPFTQSYVGETAQGKAGGFHEMRFGIKEKKLVILTTCGYTDTNIIYESLKKEFDFICGNDNYTFISCPQGELFGIDAFKEITESRLKLVEEAGALFGEDKLTEEAKDGIAQPMIPARAFEMILKKNWADSREEYLKKFGDGQ